MDGLDCNSSLSLSLAICILMVNGSSANATLRPDPELLAALEAQSATPRDRRASEQTPTGVQMAKRRVASSDQILLPTSANSESADLSYPDRALTMERERTAPSTESTLAASFQPSNHDKHFSVVIPSVVYHGFAIDKDVADQMPRKLDGGQTVVTPGVGLEYVSRGGFMMLGGVLKDCYDNLAGMIQVGQQFKVLSHTAVGYSLGIYARETPIACSTTTDRRGRKSTVCNHCVTRVC